MPRWTSSASAYGIVPRSITSKSGMDHAPHGVQGRLGDRFGESWVRVDRESDLLDGELFLPGARELRDRLGGVGADDVGAQDLAILGLPNDLDEPVGLARRARTAIRRERELPDLVLELLCFARLLRESDRRDLWMTVRRVGNVAVVDRVRLLTSEQLRDHHAFTLPLVGQHWWARD